MKGSAVDRTVRESAVTLPPRTLRPLDANPVDAVWLCAHPAAWFSVAADQPFLSYLSTVRDGVTPAGMRYGVLPSRLEE